MTIMPAGHYVDIGKSVKAFIPDPLPPTLSLTDDLQSMLSEADRAIGALSGLGRTLSNPQLLIQPFLRIEAVASSRIEGTQADIGQLTLFEELDQPSDADPDLQETINYVVALEYGLSLLEHRSISLALLKEMHAILMRGVRGEFKKPGEIRSIQNFIGGRSSKIEHARFIPPPPLALSGLLDNLELYIRDDRRGLPLVRLAIAHYQFEAIHPFLDGNGRLGRLMMSLLFRSWNLLPYPFLYLSAYFEQHRDAYLDGLLGVSTDNDWAGWIGFFLEAVSAQSNDALARSFALQQLQSHYRQMYHQGKSGRTLRTVDLLFERPVISIRRLATTLEVSQPTASNIVGRLVDDGILMEMTGQKRNRIFSAVGIFHVLEGVFLPSEA